MESRIVMPNDNATARMNSAMPARTMSPKSPMSLPMPPSVLIGVSGSRSMVPMNVGPALGYVAADMRRASNQKHQNQDFHGQKTIHLIDTRKQPVNGNQEMN